MVDHAALVGVLRQFSRNLVTGYQITDILYALCDAAVEVVKVSGAGVMLADEAGVLRFVSASDDVIRRVETLQIELEEGPCLAAYEQGSQVIVADLQEAGDFPDFGPGALAAGMRGVYSFPMWAGSHRLGALNLYSADPLDFAAEELAAGQTLADVATGYILNARLLEEQARLSEQLQHALSSRVLIEQAKGKLSAQLGVPVDEAFDRMRRYSRGQGLKLRAVATEIVEDRLRLQQDDS